MSIHINRDTGVCQHFVVCGIPVHHNIGYTGNPRLARFRLAPTSVSTVELFVTMARLARGQTWVSTVKIGARRVKIRHAVKKFDPW